LFLLGLVAACPPPRQGAGGAMGGGGGGGAGINPDACGNISVNPVGRRLHSFLVASAELDRASLELEQSVLGACRKMAQELGITPTGDTRAVCAAVVAELDANLKVSVSQEKRLVTRTVPPECTTDVDFAASVVAECEAKLATDIDVTCEGRCGGTCNGACDGTCSGGGAGGECAGMCSGTCRGECTGSCQGYAAVDASVECKASAEVRATLNTTCTEPRVEIVEQDVTIIDDSKFQKAMAAIRVGMPTILRVGKKAELVARAAVLWGKTLGGLVRSTGELIADLGERTLCVGGQFAASIAALAQIEARFSVSIEVSASISASAGASAQ
jgi:hypothetical protein